MTLSGYSTLVLLEIAIAVPTFLSLFFVVAPYGRHTRKGWGPTLPARLGWILMESPASLFFLWVYLLGPRRWDAVPLALLCLWQIHYVYRAFVFPLRMRATGRRMPVAIPAMAIAFNLLNAWINARWISAVGTYPEGWFSDPRFVLGTALFLVGFAVNVDSDRRLRALRAPGETGYAIPRGGAFELVSAPNYLGEIVEWCGWAIASWSPAGLAFALYTIANLAPRAFSNHRWYRERFPDYPARRRALIPFLL